MSPGPEDWQRAAKGMGLFTVPVLTPGTGAAAPVVEETVEAMERRAEVARKRAALEAEAEEEREMRREERQARIARARAEQMRLLEPPAHANTPDPGVLSLMRTVMEQNQRDKDQLLSDLRDAQHSRAAEAQAATAAQLRALESRLEHLATPQPASTNALKDLMDQAQTFVSVRSALDNVMPHQTAAAVGLNREQALEQQRIEEEVRLRNRELDARLAEAQANSDAARMERENSQRRIDRVLGTVDQAAGPLIAAIVGDRFGNLAGGGGNGAAPHQQPQHTYQPAPPDAGLPPAPSLLPYECPYCKSVNYEPPGTTSAKCPRCAQFVMLTPNGPPG